MGGFPGVIASKSPGAFAGFIVFHVTAAEDTGVATDKTNLFPFFSVQLISIQQIARHAAVPGDYLVTMQWLPIWMVT